VRKGLAAIGDLPVRGGDNFVIVLDRPPNDGCGVLFKMILHLLELLRILTGKSHRQLACVGIWFILPCPHGMQRINRILELSRLLDEEGARLEAKLKSRKVV